MSDVEQVIQSLQALRTSVKAQVERLLVEMNEARAELDRIEAALADLEHPAAPKPSGRPRSTRGARARPHARTSPQQTWKVAQLVEELQARRVDLPTDDPVHTVRAAVNTAFRRGELERVGVGSYRSA